MWCGQPTQLERLQIGSQRPDSVLLVLDASESAYEHRDEIVRVARETVGRLSHARNCEVAFLGSSKRYPVDVLESPLNERFRQHESRASLLGPVVRNLEDQTRRLAIIGSGQVFDLSDWSHDSRFEALLLYAVANPLADIEHESATTVESPAELADCLDPVTSSIEVTGKEFVPIEWECDAELQVRDGKLVLVISNIEEPVEILVDGESSSTISAMGRTPNDRQVEFPTTCERAPAVRVGDLPLGDSEAIVLSHILRDKPFECPFCGMQHSSHETSCNQDDHPKYRFRGRPLLPSLAGLSKRHWVICQLHDAHVSCRAFHQRVLRLSSTALLTRSSERVWQFAKQAGHWGKKRVEIRPYLDLGGGAYVVDVG